MKSGTKATDLIMKSTKNQIDQCFQTNVLKTNLRSIKIFTV